MIGKQGCKNDFIRASLILIFSMIDRRSNTGT